jgi:hypothetical protein
MILKFKKKELVQKGMRNLGLWTGKAPEECGE